MMIVLVLFASVNGQCSIRADGVDWTPAANVYCEGTTNIVNRSASTGQTVNPRAVLNETTVLIPFYPDPVPQGMNDGGNSDRKKCLASSPYLQCSGAASS